MLNNINIYKALFIGIIFLIICQFKTYSQPVGGYLGHRFMTSLELELLPNKFYHESVQFSFLYRTYTLNPRVFLNTEYQINKNNSIGVRLGFTNLNVSFGSELIPISTTMYQVRLISSPSAVNMPFSPLYFICGIGVESIYIESGNGLEAEKAGDQLYDFAVNIEFGRRIVFENRMLVQFGISSALPFKGFRSFTSLDMNDRTSAIYERNLQSSILNFKLSFGYIY